MTAALAKIPTDKLLKVMEGLPGYAGQRRFFPDFLRAYGKGVTVASLGAYVEDLRRRLGGETTQHGGPISAGTYNLKVTVAKEQVRLLFERSPEAIDVTKRWKIEQELGKLPRAKVNSVAVKREKGKRTMVLTPEEIAQLVAMPDDAIPGAAAVRLFIQFLAYTGARISEAINVALTDVVPAGGKKDAHCRVRLVGKGNKEREVMLAPDLIDRIRSHFSGETWLFEHTGRRYSRVYLTGAIQRAGEAILGRRISAHTLRHSFVTSKIAQTKNWRGVSRYVGHSSPSTTLSMYDHSELTWEDIAGKANEK